MLIRLTANNFEAPRSIKKAFRLLTEGFRFNRGAGGIRTLVQTWYKVSFLHA